MPVGIHPRDLGKRPADPFRIVENSSVDGSYQRHMWVRVYRRALPSPRRSLLSSRLPL